MAANLIVLMTRELLMHDCCSFFLSKNVMLNMYIVCILQVEWMLPQGPGVLHMTCLEEHRLLVSTCDW